MSTAHLKKRIEAINEIGFVCLGCEPAAGAHAKIHVRYKGEEFFITTSRSSGSDHRAFTNFKMMLRNIKRAIDTGDATLRNKYLPRHQTSV